MAPRHRVLGVDAARRAGGGAGGAGVLLLPVRDPAAARLPLLHHRAVRRRPRGLGGDPAPRPDAGWLRVVRARLLGRLRRARRPVRRCEPLVLRVLADLHGRARRLRRGAGAGVHGGGPAFPARRPGAPGPRGRPRGGAAARLPLRPGLDAVHRADARRDPLAGLRRERHPRRRAARVLLDRPRRALHPGRPGLATRARRDLVPTPAPAVDHPGRRPDAGRGGAPAADRLVGPRRPVAADPPGPRLPAERLMTTTATKPTAPAPERRSGELTLRELLRWTWRQLTSMRIALILLLLLALAAVPGSLVPQGRVVSLKAGDWKKAHETLTPIYEKLGIFNVYASAWFAAIYILLVISLLGCIIPRTFVYARGLRAQPPAAPRHPRPPRARRTPPRRPSHASYATAEPAEVVLERARAVLRKKRYRLRRDPDG